MAIDIPHIWLYLAELLSPVLKEGGFSMRELFRYVHYALVISDFSASSRKDKKNIFLSYLFIYIFGLRKEMVMLYFHVVCLFTVN